jgi:Leucine-rich repeat (LRR) protein
MLVSVYLSLSLADSHALQSLSLRQNFVPTIQGLEGLTQLEQLELRDNSLEKIEGLETLTQLK